MGCCLLKVPPVSAKTRPTSCQRRWGQSEAPSGPHGLSPAALFDVPAATSRARRTSAENSRARARMKKDLVEDYSRSCRNDDETGHRNIVLIAGRQLLEPGYSEPRRLARS